MALEIFAEHFQKRIVFINKWNLDKKQIYELESFKKKRWKNLGKIELQYSHFPYKLDYMATSWKSEKKVFPKLLPEKDTLEQWCEKG